jgi:hypothetical protein
MAGSYWVVSFGGVDDVDGPATRAQALADAKSGGGTLVSGPYLTQAKADAAISGGTPAPGPSNGRPWFVAYNQYLSGDLHFGTLFVPFQPANEAEELLLQANPLEYRQFPTEAAAETWINSPAGRKAQGLDNPGKTIGSAVTGTLTGVNAIGGFFAKIGDRSTWVRIIKVVVGAIMIIAGLVRLGAPGAEQVASKLPKVIPV